VGRGLLAALLCGAALATGCGGGDDGDEGAPATPKATETLEQFQARLKTAVAGIQSGQCDAVEAFNAKAGAPLPCEARAKRLFKGFRVTGAKAYGTGAVIEFKDAEVRNQIGIYTAAIGEDGKYQLTGPIFPIFPVSTLGQQPKDLDKMDDAAQAMVDAIRANNCDRYFEAVYNPPELPKPQACQQELGVAYGPLREQLAKHKRLAGNAAFMFYALRTGDEYRTLIVSQGGSDAAPRGFVTFRGPTEEKT
jgi:hypothetical protein